MFYKHNIRHTIRERVKMVESLAPNGSRTNTHTDMVMEIKETKLERNTTQKWMKDNKVEIDKRKLKKED